MDTEWQPDIGDQVILGDGLLAVVVSISLEFEIVTVLVHTRRLGPRPYAVTFEWARAHWEPAPNEGRMPR